MPFIIDHIVVFRPVPFVCEDCDHLPDDCINCIIRRLPGPPGILTAARAVAGPAGEIIFDMQELDEYGAIERFDFETVVEEFDLDSSNRAEVFAAEVPAAGGDDRLIAFATNFYGAGANDPMSHGWTPLVILPPNAAGVSPGNVLHVAGRIGPSPLTPAFEGGNVGIRRGFAGNNIIHPFAIVPGAFDFSITLTQADISAGVSFQWNFWGTFGPAFTAGTHDFIISIDDLIVVESAEVPTITAQPADHQIPIGGTVPELSVTATVGAGILTYQWFSAPNATAAGTIITGATESTFTPDIDTDEEGDFFFYVVVTNTDASLTANPTATTTSGRARITVGAPVTYFYLDLTDILTCGNPGGQFAAAPVVTPGADLVWNFNAQNQRGLIALTPEQSGLIFANGSGGFTITIDGEASPDLRFRYGLVSPTAGSAWWNQSPWGI